MNKASALLNIVIAVHHFPPTYKGGAEWRAYRTAHSLLAQGHSARVICVEAIDDSTAQPLRWEDKIEDGLPVRRLYLNLDMALDRHVWEYDNPWIEDHLQAHFSENKPDIFHLISGYLMTAGALKAARQAHIPTIVTLTDFWYMCHRITLQRSGGALCSQNTALDCLRCEAELKRRFRIPAQKMPPLTNAIWNKLDWLPLVSKGVARYTQRARVLQETLAGVDLAIAPSQFLQNMYLQRNFSARKMVFLRQGLARLPQKPIQKTPSTTLRLGYIGQIAEHKGVHVLIDAFLQLQNQNVELKIYGSITQFPQYYQRLQTKVGHNKRIKFMNTFDNRQIGQIYQNLDALVVPSTWYENSPNVILEAFAYKTPVIASNLGGMAELVTHNKTGLLFTPADAADLARQIEQIIEQPGLIQSWQKNIPVVVGVEDEIEDLLKLYRETLLTHSETFDNPYV